MEHETQNAPPPEVRNEAPVPQWAQAVNTEQELQRLRDNIARSKGLQ